MRTKPSFLFLCVLCVSQSLFSQDLNVRSHGAAGDGKGDDTAAFRAAIAEAAKQGGGTVLVPAGSYLITDSLNLPDGVALRGAGRGASRLLAPPASGFDLLAVNAADAVTIADLSLVEESPRDAKGRGNGIAINDGAKFLLVENVNITGFLSGFSIGRAEKREVASVTLRNCRVERSRQYGFDLANCRVVLLDTCFAYNNWLDGIKLRKLTQDVTVRGGESSWNGTSRLADPALNGNGVDAFAGGNGFVIDGLVTEHNQGSGIYVKTGAVQHMGDAMIGNGFITNVRSRFNIGSGLDINRSGGDRPNPQDGRIAPLVGDMVVTGGIFEGNTRAGIFLRGRNITLLAPIAKRNDKSGIEIASGGDISIIGALVSANSRAEPGKWPGIEVGSDVAGIHRVTIRDGAINGVDSQGLADAESAEGQTVYHKAAIRLSPKSEDIRIEGVRMRNWTQPGDPVAGGAKQD